MRKYIGMEKERTEGEEKERNGRIRKRDDRGERMSDRKNGTKTINLSAVEDTSGEKEIRGKGENFDGGNQGCDTRGVKKQENEALADQVHKFIDVHETAVNTRTNSLQGKRGNHAKAGCETSGKNQFYPPKKQENKALFQS